ncbi:MAG: hydantoinase/oxoprolinase family protein [Pseudomonadota bacterium]
MAASQVKFGADIGGTFTDAVLEVDGALFSTKVLTTYAAPEDAILEGLATVCDRAGISPADITHIIHGTTLATNALIERRGAKTAFITSAGFRDVIEMRTESRFEQYDLDLELPKPLLARNHRYTVTGRLAANGDELIPVDDAEIDAVVETIAARGYESVAVGLLHSYLDASHERAVGNALRARLPDVAVSLSADVSPQMREYERFNTTVANAYVKPMMARYLGRLGARLADAGASCPIFLMHSGGGIISLASACEFPVRLVESGPAGGAIFAADIAGRFGVDKALSFDMGGTTAKICLIRDQAPKTARVFEVARTYRFKKGSGMPISIPVIDMVEIGAGGGSLAQVDSLRQIRVGPESAGSEPGPACYGQGGERPAVTDADLVLGRLDAENFAGGAIPLHIENSQRALIDAVGDPLGMDASAAAFGVSEMVDENMSNAARVHAVENGEDLASYTMIAFGGAAPLHAGRLCEKLGVDRLLVPAGAGVGSAIGFLRAPFSFEATRSHYMRMSAFEPAAVRAILDDLRKEALGFVASCAPDGDVGCTFKVFMRYIGQGWEIPVPLTLAHVESPQADAFLEAFEEEYRALFARTVTGLDTEITVWAADASTARHAPERVAESATRNMVTAGSSRTLFDPSRRALCDSGEIARDALGVGHSIAGPAVITEDETTIVVPRGFAAVMQADGTLDISRAPEEKSL